jgi:hypothetical protein
VKKFLLFSLLFVAGFMVLRAIESPLPVEAVEVVDDDPEVGESAPISVPRGDSESDASEPEATPRTGDEDDAEVKVEVRGPMHITKRVEEGPNRPNKLYYLESKQSRSVAGGFVELIDVSAIAYDPVTSREVLLIEAAKGRVATIDLLGGTGDIFSDDIVLFDVRLTLLANAPIVPLALDTEVLVCSLQDNGRFRTDSRVTIQGQGIEASGTGFEFNSKDELLRFDHDGFADVELKLGHRAKLTSEGALEIGRTEDGEGPILLKAEGHAVLAQVGTNPIQLSAEHLAITGQADGNESKTLGFQSIQAEGDVELSLEGNRFSSDTATVTLVGDEGDLHAELSGSPHGSFQLVGDGSAALGEEDFTIAFNGDGPLIVRRREEVEFNLAGPAELSWADAKLLAVDDIHGSLSPKNERALFVAVGDVRVQRENSSMLTPEFRLKHRRRSEGTSELTAVAAGPAWMTGSIDEDHDFRLTTEQPIEFSVQGELWRVPRASGIALVVEGPHGFVARANEVIGFSAEPLELVAVGDIELTSANGDVKGERLVLRGLDSMSIDGLPDQLAHFRSNNGEWFALHVERQYETVTATGVKNAVFTDGVSKFEFDCDRLLVEDLGTNDQSANGMQSRGVRFSGGGSVVGTASSAGEQLELNCEQFDGEWSEKLRDGEFLYSKSSFTASNSVIAQFTRDQHRYDLSSDSLSLSRTNRGSETLTSDKLIAIGNVEVQTASNGRMHGKGDRLEIDKLGRGELIANEGNRISAEGMLAEDKLPYAMTARRLVFSDTYLEAAYPEFEFHSTEPLEEGEDKIHTRASANRMEATEDSLVLDGDVRLEGVIEGMSSWILLSDSAHVDVQTTESSGVMGALRAVGQVEFDFQGIMYARGDNFQFQSAKERVRIEGSPAKIFYRDMNIETDWFEYFFQLHTFASADNTIILPVQTRTKADKK